MTTVWYASRTTLLMLRDGCHRGILTLVILLVLAASACAALAPDGAGSAVVDFNGTCGREIEVRCGTYGTWTITYTVPEGGMAAGSGITVYREPNKYWLGQCKQTKDPKALDYVTASRSDGGPVDITYIGGNYKDHKEVQVKVKDPPLGAGSTISIKVGDTSGGSKGAITPLSWQPPCTYHIESDLDGNGTAKRIAQPLVMRPVAGPAAKLVVNVPLIVKAGEKVRLGIRAEDQGSNVAESFKGEVVVECTDPKAAYARKVEFGTKNRGVRTFEITFGSPGIHYVSARSVCDAAFGCSNPCKVSEGDPTYRVYCGDLHCHTDESDGTGSLDFNYRYARDISRLDFIAVSDHLDPHENDEPTVASDRKPRRTVTEFNDVECAAARKYHAPGEFVTFLAYEWGLTTDKGGDHIVYYMDDRSRFRARYDLRKEYEDVQSRGDKAGWIIGHVGGRPANPDFFDAVVEPAVEINSMHGHFEWFAQSYLQRGHKVGFIGASDGHFGLPGNDIWPNHGRLGLSRRDVSVPQGLALVYAPALSREAIRDAIFARRTYATTNVRMLLEVTMDEHMMGEEYSSGAAPSMHILAAGTGEIGRIEIIRNKERILSRKTSGKVVELDFTDDEPAAGTSYYYVRVSQEDGETAWSSPIFFTYTGPAVEANRQSVPWNYESEEEELGAPVHTDYLARLQDHLSWRAPGRFQELRQVRTVSSPRGDYALFYGLDGRGGGRVHIRWYLGFDTFRMHSARGWRDFGAR